MNRSGTSALTRVLSLCGAALPTGLVGANAGNPRGYWEPFESHRVNYTILRRHGSEWFDPTMRLQEKGAFEPAERAAYITEIEAYLRTLPVAPVVVLKDLNITALSELWFEAARLAGLNVAVVIAVRHPQEVAASLAALNRTSPELASALWLKGNLLAERTTRTMPRVFVDYSCLLENWRREVKRISTALQLDLDSRDAEAIEGFLEPSLHRQRQREGGGPVAEPFGTDWVSVVHQAVSAAALDESWEQDSLDGVFEAYVAGERGFRIALQNFHRFHRLNRLLFRPSLVKLVVKVKAIAHRRKGPWA
ncbi:sulfotransferase family protein [Mycobacterium vicinigordonae]|uniref:Sulfotransferase family protein n=1 Tax=Mycobacterium vicinigordonae TaxID=1719132 RepID=A0A7D6E3K1_9MYCO|nr:sulfotransferase family protein [Mycobacterium vicinigordonae]QLL09930.1 sulfotransferase family protein [Mycobacterium vicinigordonae]